MAYGTDIGFTAYLAAMGYTLPVGSPTAAVLRARGSAYLDAVYGGRWTGHQTDPVTQVDQWPRTGAKVRCITAIADDVIPLAVVNAAYRAAWLEASTPGTLSASVTPGGRVSRQKADVLERAFFDDGAAVAGGGSVAFIDSEIDGAMMQFICDKTGGLMLLSVGSNC